jgi:hypothetical protein
MKRHILEHIATNATREQVTSYMGIGLNPGQIAKLLGINIATLKNQYRHELATGYDRQIARVAGTLFAIATDPSHPKSVTAGIFILKTRAGWRDRIEITGPNGQPLSVEHKHQIVDSRALTYEQRESLREILQAAVSQAALPSAEEAEEAEFEDVDDDVRPVSYGGLALEPDD